MHKRGELGYRRLAGYISIGKASANTMNGIYLVILEKIMTIAMDVITIIGA